MVLPVITFEHPDHQLLLQQELNYALKFHCNIVLLDELVVLTLDLEHVNLRRLEQLAKIEHFLYPPFLLLNVKNFDLWHQTENYTKNFCYI